MEYLVICWIYFTDGTKREFRIPAATYAEVVATIQAEMYVSESRSNERGMSCVCVGCEKEPAR